MSDPHYPEWVELYARVKFITMRKGHASLTPGQLFYHPFSAQPQMVGLGKGAIVTLPDSGDTVQLNFRSVLLVTSAHLWGYRSIGSNGR